MQASTTLDDFIQQCRMLVTESDPLPRVRSAMEQFVATPGVAEQHPPPIHCLAISGESIQHFEDETISVHMVHTPPGVEQPPHDHRMSVVIGGLRGVEMHRLYQRTAGAPAAIKLSGTKDVGAGDILTLGTHGVHAINAAAPQWATALHVYLGPLSTVDRSLFHPVTLVEEPLDLERYDKYCRND